MWKELIAFVWFENVMEQREDHSLFEWWSHRRNLFHDILNLLWILDERDTLRWEDDLYDSQVLVARLEEMTPPGTRVLGITDQPMFDVGHWWLFGTAQLGGRTAVLSTAHLWVDDIPGDTKHPLFRDRLAKVGIHEFGHTLGFVHCPNARCVMEFSPSVGVLDVSRYTFCKTCLNWTR